MKLSERLLIKVSELLPDYNFDSAIIFRQPSIKLDDVPRWIIRGIGTKSSKNVNIYEVHGGQTMKESIDNDLDISLTSDFVFSCDIK